MEKNAFSNYERDGFWLVGVALILMVGVPYWNNLNEWAKLIPELIFVFSGIILIIIGRKKRAKHN